MYSSLEVSVYSCLPCFPAGGYVQTEEDLNISNSNVRYQWSLPRRPSFPGLKSMEKKDSVCRKLFYSCRRMLLREMWGCLFIMRNRIRHSGTKQPGNGRYSHVKSCDLAAQRL